MVKMKKLLAFLLAIATVMSLTACGGNNGEVKDPTGNTVANPNAGEVTYSVELKTQGGMALADIDVYIYADETLADMKQFGKTDAEGKMSVALPESDSYVAVLSGLSKGYNAESYYAFNGNTANITIETKLLDEAPGTVLGVGDVMYDFTVTTPDGEAITLSKMLEEKDMVLLNFWYTTCSWCVKEFPYMQQAYEQYEDSVGIIALNPMEENAAVKPFQEQMGLTFPMAACPMRLVHQLRDLRLPHLHRG